MPWAMGSWPAMPDDVIPFLWSCLEAKNKCLKCYTLCFYKIELSSRLRWPIWVSFLHWNLTIAFRRDFYLATYFQNNLYHIDFAYELYSFLICGCWMSIKGLVFRKRENYRKNNDKHGILLFLPYLDKKKIIKPQLVLLPSKSNKPSN